MHSSDCLGLVKLKDKISVFHKLEFCVQYQLLKLILASNRGLTNQCVNPGCGCLLAATPI